MIGTSNLGSWNGHWEVGIISNVRNAAKVWTYHHWKWHENNNGTCMYCMIPHDDNWLFENRALQSALFIITTSKSQYVGAFYSTKQEHPHMCNGQSGYTRYDHPSHHWSTIYICYSSPKCDNLRMLGANLQHVWFVNSPLFIPVWSSPQPQRVDGSKQPQPQRRLHHGHFHHANEVAEIDVALLIRRHSDPGREVIWIIGWFSSTPCSITKGHTTSI